jgi:hypothetical protein
MNRAGWFLCVVVASALIFSGSALAQGDASYYFVTYFSNNVSGAPDATVRITNDGYDGYTLYPFFSVFDDSQELQACGYCAISPDGLLSEDVKTELTNNPLTGKIPSRGVRVLSGVGAARMGDPHPARKPCVWRLYHDRSRTH